MQRNKKIIAAIIVLASVYFALQISMGQKGSKSGVDTRSSESLGLSISKKYLDDQLRINKKPFHDYTTLKQYDLIAIHSPKFPLSKYEIETLKTYVYEGGELFLSALNLGDYARLNLGTFFKQTTNDKKRNSWIEAVKNKDFKNGQTEKVTWDTLPESVNYSSINWVGIKLKDGLKGKSNTHKNEQKPEEETVILDYGSRYKEEWSLGKGRVKVLLGLPPYANAMLQFEENQKFLRAFKEQYPRILWDAYHHYVQEATMGDLLSDVQVVVPILGFIVFILLYFLMSARHPIFVKERQSVNQAPSYHSFYEGLYSTLFTHNKGREDAYVFFHEKINKLYGLKQGKLIKTGQMDEKEFSARWKKTLEELAKHFKRREKKSKS